jgi:hypothetical protein
MKSRTIAWLMVVTLLAAAEARADSADEKRAKTRKMAAQTLQDLYKLQPTELPLPKQVVCLGGVAGDATVQNRHQNGRNWQQVPVAGVRTS